MRSPSLASVFFKIISRDSFLKNLSTGETSVFDFTLKKFENALDWIAGAVARVAYLSQRSVKLNDYTDETAFDPTLPIEVTDTTSQTIVTKADGTGFEIGPTVAAIAAAQAQATAAAASAAAALASELAAAASEAAVAAALLATNMEKFTTGFAALTDPGLTVSITSFSLEAKEVIEYMTIKHTTLFAAPGLTSLLISVGITGDEALLVDSFDVLQTVDDQEFLTMDLNYIASFASSTNIIISAVAIGANLDALTAGSVDVYAKIKGMN